MRGMSPQPSAVPNLASVKLSFASRLWALQTLQPLKTASFAHASPLCHAAGHCVYAPWILAMHFPGAILWTLLMA